MDRPLGAVFASWHGAKAGACESTAAALNNKNLNDMVVVSSNASLWESVVVAVTKQPWCKTHISCFIKNLNQGITVLLRLHALRASPSFAALTLSQTCCTARRALNAAPSGHATI